MKILKNGRRRTAMLTSALALVLIPFSAGTASANTTPGWGDDMPDVIWDCNNGNADSCQYHEQNAETELGKRRQASNVISNCASNQPVTLTRTDSNTSSTEYAFEQQTSVEVSAGFSDTFEAGMKASESQSETWKVGSAHTATETHTSTIPPGQQGAWWFAPYVRHSQGYLEVHYGSRNHGHYIWYYPGNGGLPGVDVLTPVFLPGTGELKGVWYWATWNC
ncbi:MULTISPECIES: hypothetical protein [unclassified Streptomyces]|uniref:hypothetical protein n=1 Tax=unclassified Streptomyces TaxID=2593676 RepID=UPI002365300B|nr:MULTISPECIES: hypothetical protein [unclassified Streptomyces]MDF3146123.1 hypothetical protein [Streptomyces sp. T21Q-yed]WDF39751.1 hypothetical protein PBV52_24610 [Streptomyces sp. T12]